MAEDASAKKTCVVSKRGVKIIIGSAFIILGLAAVIGWWPELKNLIKGCLGLFLIMLGAITIIVAK